MTHQKSCRHLLQYGFLLLFSCALLACSTQQESPLPKSSAAARNWIHTPSRTSLVLEQLCEVDDVPSLEDWQPYGLWDRLRSNFQWDTNHHKLTEVQLAWYAKHPEYIARVSTRGSLYLYYIVSELEKRNLPGELALLPIVESAFDTFAYSPGRASGMWQIIPGTGKMLGLKQNWWYDGRRDVIASTDAALNYLEQLYAQFDGNWLHALAAYNSGSGTVSRAIARNEKLGLPTNFWNLELPRETRGYVPRLLALARLYASPESYQVTLPYVENRATFARIEVGAQIDLAEVARLADISMDELYQLNPGFNRWATDPAGPHEVLVPIEKESHFARGLAAIPPEKRVTWRRHRIAQGETLSHIAKKYRLDIATLREINDLRGSSIRAGNTLLVPQAGREAGTYTLGERRAVAAKPVSQAPGKGQRIQHVVKAGESFWLIAKRYKVSTTELTRWNNLSPRDPLKVGQQLAVWLPDRKVPAQSAKPQKKPVVRKLSYTVRKGDSLARIAGRFDVRLKDVVEWNQLSLNEYLQPGDALVLFVDVTR